MFIEKPITIEKPRKLINGIGVNDAPYSVSYREDGKLITCPYYKAWVAMFQRCYSAAWHERYPSYVGCSVAPVWHKFTSFREWMQTQDWETKQLDKDIKVPGNKEYGPTVCLWVSSQINSLFNTGALAKSGLPVGVTKHWSGRFEVGVSFGTSKRSYVGSFKTVREAADAYVKAKAEAIALAADKEPDPIIQEAVRAFGVHYLQKLKNANTAF
jgi:hypothetical protein